MTYFDDEPSTGGSYEDAFSVQIWDPDGIPRRIVVRHRGRFDRVAIGLEEIRMGSSDA